MTTRNLRFAAVALVLSTALPVAFAAILCDPFPIAPPASLPQDEFGAACAISGDRAVVGARGTAARAGAVYLFDRLAEGGVLTGTLFDARGVQGDEFGGAVALHGSVMVAGARFATGSAAGIVLFQAGAAMTFRWNGSAWVADAQLPSDYLGLKTGAQFGAAVAVANRWVMVGAPGSDALIGASTCTGCGSVHVYRYHGGQWESQPPIAADDGQTLDGFGSALALSGDWVFVGAPTDHIPSVPGSSGPGSVYVYHWSGFQWLQVQRLNASDAAAGRNFGHAIAADGELAAIADRNGQRVYVFRLSGGNWVEEAILQGSDTATGDRFAGSVALSGNRVAVGAERDDDGGLSNSGTVFLFELRDGVWEQAAKLHAPGAAAGDRFGSCVALQALLLTGAVGDGGARGSVFVQTLPEPDCNGNGVSDGCEISTDPDADANGDGVLDECECPPGACTPPTSCSTVMCVPGTTECLYAVAAGYCLIDGACVTDSTQNPANPCERCDAALSPRSWTFTPSGAPCGASANPCENDGACDGAGICTGTPKLDGTPCPTDGSFCGGTAHCRAGDCEPDGGPCAGNPFLPYCDEAADRCVACLQDAHCDDGQDCTTERCDNGTCARQTYPAGTGCGDPRASDCDAPDTCDAGGICRQNRQPNGAPCSDDGLYCTGTESCQAGRCQSSGDPCRGVPGALFCDDVNDRCARCISDADCDDAHDCTYDACVAYQCEHGNQPAGWPCGNQTDTDCRDPDTCNGLGQCVYNLAPTGAPCADDGLVCNGVEYCSAGQCRSTGSPCPAGLACSEEHGRCVCNDNTDCDDTLFCNGTETCVDGDCITSPLPCTGPGELCRESNNTCITCQSTEDCNGNGIPDDCDIALGTSYDSNANGVPDECAPCAENPRFRLMMLDGAPTPEGGRYGYFILTGTSGSHRAGVMINDAADILVSSDAYGVSLGSSYYYRGLWKTTGDDLVSIARTRAPLPGGPPDYDAFRFEDVRFDHDGQVAFRARVSWDSSSYRLVYWSRPTWAGAIYEIGQQAPGLESGIRFTGFTSPPGLAGGRNLVVSATAARSTSTYPDYHGIWSWRSGYNELVVRSGDPAPGAGPGARFYEVYAPKINAHGRIAFYALLSGPEITDQTRDSLWIADAGSLRLVAKSGTPIPGAPPGTQIRDLVRSWPSVPRFALNDAGEVAFEARQEPDSGDDDVGALLLATSDGLNTVIRRFDGSGRLGSQPRVEKIVWDGQLTENLGPLFSATYYRWTGGAVERFSGLLSGTGGDPVPFPAPGGHLPGTELGVEYRPTQTMVTRADQFVFHALLSGSVTPFNDRAVVLGDWNGRLVMLVRKGMRIDLDGYGCATITDFEFPVPNSSFPGEPQIVNAHGAVVLYATLDAREKAIIVVSPAGCQFDADCDDGDECGVDVCADGICMSEPVLGCGLDCNRNELSDDCDVRCGPSGGRCDRPGCGLSSDCNADLVPDECAADCQGNSIPDVCEIVANPALDCNGDRLLDRCYLGSSNDCNQNGQLDYCEVRDGLTADCDGSGRPDECEVGSSPSADCNDDGILDDCARDGNCDCDHDVDLTDYATLRPCMRGPGRTVSFSCECRQLDGDRDVDLADFARFQLFFAPPPGRSRLPDGDRGSVKPPG